MRRQPRGKRRVEDRVARDKAEVGDRIFAVVASGDDGGDGRFRSRAGGGGDGDERRNAAANLQKSRERGKAPVRPDKKRRGGLGRVHRRAAADDEEAVAAVDAVLLGDFFDRFDRGVRLNGGKDGEQNILHIQNLLQAAEVLVRALAAACDDKGTAQAVFTQNVRHAKKAPVSRIDFRRPPGEQARTCAEAALECAAGK